MMRYVIIAALCLVGYRAGRWARNRHTTQAPSASPVVASANRTPRPAPVSPPVRSGLLPPGEFKTLYLLILSLLHGNIFFALTESMLIASEKGADATYWSLVVFNYVIFFRILQSQLMAALKYDSRWTLGVFDYLVVFLTCLFEYVLFTRVRFSWGGEDFFLRLILGFAAFGAFGYLLTYLRTSGRLPKRIRRVELVLQSTNVLVLVVVGGLALSRILGWSHLTLPGFHYASAFLLLVNVYVSMKATLSWRRPSSRP